MAIQQSFNVQPALVRAAQIDGELVVVGTDRSVQAWARTQNTSFEKLDEVPLPSGVRSIEVVRGLAYVVGEEGWLRILDFRNPAAPRVLSRSKLDAHELLVSGGQVLATGPAGVSLLNLPQAVPATAAGLVTVGQPAMTLTAFRGGALVAAGASGVQAVDVTRSAVPVLAGQLFTGSDVQQVERIGRDTFVLDGTAIRFARETTAGTLTSDNTETQGLQQALGSIDRLAVARDRLWAISTSGAVKTIQWPRVGPGESLILGSAAFDVAGDERHALVALGNHGAAIVGVAPSGQIRRSGTLPVTASAVALEGALAVVGGPSSLSVFELTDDASPELLGTVPTSGPVQRIRLEGRLAIISEGAAGVELWHLPAGAPAVRLMHVPASNAHDAIVAAGRLLVADTLEGNQGAVRAYMPPAAAVPSVRIATPANYSVVEAGTNVVVSALAGGIGLDDAELVVDGVASAVAEEAGMKARWTVPAGSAAGQRHELRFRVRGAGGMEALSSPLTLTVLPPETQTPSVSLTAPTEGTTIASGAAVTVRARRTEGIAPVFVSARLGTTYLGELGQSPSDPMVFESVFRAPMTSAPETLPLTVLLVDGAGRTAEASVQVSLGVDNNAPGVPSGLPTQLRAEPAVNPINLQATDDGVLWIELEKDGELIAHSQESIGTASLHHALLLPEDSVGQQVTLTATAVDFMGRRTPVSQSYVVAVDGVPPTVNFGSYQPPLSAFEGASINIYASASDPDSDVASVKLYANGVEFASSIGHYVSASYLLPKLSEQSSVVFRAVATDRSGRTTAVERTTTLQANPAPELTYTMTPNPALRGEIVRICARARDNSSIEHFSASVDGEALLGSVSCGAQCVDICADKLMELSAMQVVVESTATDDLGATASGSDVFQVNENQPPLATLRPITSMSVGIETSLSGTWDDERVRLAWAEFRVNGVRVGSRIETPYRGYGVTRGYTPNSSGVVRVSLVVQDSLGLQSETYQDVNVIEPLYPADTTDVIAADDFRFEGMDIVVRGSDRLRIDGTHAFKNLYIQGNAVVTHSPAGGVGANHLDLHVEGEVRIDSSATIDVSGHGLSL
ncbi:hypothetical protein, partial [Myxococcus vastator]|uniref:hypothetical protein n=1 Tax=Myxococcus vastator TaxID=2709664 RepID=UPI001968A2F7